MFTRNRKSSPPIVSGWAEGENRILGFWKGSAEALKGMHAVHVTSNLIGHIYTLSNPFQLERVRVDSINLIN